MPLTLEPAAKASWPPTGGRPYDVVKMGRFGESLTQFEERKNIRKPDGDSDLWRRIEFNFRTRNPKEVAKQTPPPALPPYCRGSAVSAVIRCATTFLFLVLPALLPAQSEDALRRYFEGQTFRVKIDLPATKNGMDVYWRQEPPVDMKSYSQRIRNFGVALRAGDSVAVTALRVKGKNIEFQLGGGGYGVAGDEADYVAIPSPAPKSDREIELEKQISGERDSDYRDRLKRELARLKDRREEEDRRLRAQAEELAARKKEEIAVKRLHAGSRINIWFPEGRLKEATPSPQELIAILTSWIDFDNRPDQSGPSPGRQYPGRITRGMSRAETHAALGQPLRTTTSRQGDLDTTVEIFEISDERVEVVFVNDVVVKYMASSK